MAELSKKEQKRVDSLLLDAVTERSVSRVKRAILDGADIETQDALGWRPLHYATFGGDEKLVSHLLSLRASPNAKAHDGTSPLLISASRGLVNICASLLQAGAKVDETDKINGLTALMSAAESGNAKLIEMLLGAGADCLRLNNEGKSAVDFVRDVNDHKSLALIETAVLNNAMSQSRGDGILRFQSVG